MSGVEQAERQPVRLHFLDGLRGVLATYVVASHAYDTVFPGARVHRSTVELLTAFLAFGRYAVSGFIVVSGISLGLVFWKNDGSWPGGIRSFAVRRLRRIGPPYWAAIVLGVTFGTTLLAAPDGTLWDGAIPSRPLGVLVHTLLLQDVTWAGPAGSTAFWSIAIEVHIYVLFALCLFLLHRRRGSWAALYLALTTLTAVTIYEAQRGATFFGVINGLYPGLYAIFFLGVGLARERYRIGRVKTTRWMIGLGAAFVGACVIAVVDRRGLNIVGPICDLFVGPLFAGLVLSLLIGRLPRLCGVLSGRGAQWLGASSYSLYLIHPALLEVSWRFIVKPLHLSGIGGLVAELLVGLTVSIMGARIFYHAIERPSSLGFPWWRAQLRRQRLRAVPRAEGIGEAVIPYDP